MIEIKRRLPPLRDAVMRASQWNQQGNPDTGWSILNNALTLKKKADSDLAKALGRPGEIHFACQTAALEAIKWGQIPDWCTCTNCLAKENLE